MNRVLIGDIFYSSNSENLKKIKNLEDKFCCNFLQLRLEKDDSRLHYDRVLREFYIERIYDSSSAHVIKNCPWCGKKFPKELRSEWFNILEKEYNIEPEVGKNGEWVDNVPKEFKSDEWWKKRGL
ncbi:DUF6980 family protein [endosymbiont GvMRE of Glomus versiforme]|uniref:DUF6980 family protein n=1 Tax=endosymbiont GvMRE of Glomus versiforme TaxID=2039283 RepID=UPI000EE4C431|nr:hypothetical protein [endosymbiont GvMRE of Glomus versiforme]RHZ35264.1 hypothetical protein GvMRE_IIg462 [endosymbiont GvMRE of Glomus versiforme]